MDKFRKKLHHELESVPVIDPHCHLRPHKPEADNLADILLYHHMWIELVSAGMPLKAVTKAGMPHECQAPEIPPLERVKTALPYLKHIRSTTLGVLIRRILNDLYGVS